MKQLLKKIFNTCLLVFSTYLSVGQIVLNGDAVINLNGGTSDNPIFVVLTQTTSAPIITNSANSGFIVEDEFNRLQYNLGTSTQSISVPYMTQDLEQLPLAVVTNTSGTGSGNIRFSAKVAPTTASGWDNFSYAPTGVTNMYGGSIVNNSSRTLDRFWIIEANDYTTKPAVTLEFSYLEEEWQPNGGNTITENNLMAQRFNSIIESWGGYNPAGIINTSSNILGNVGVASEDFFGVWVLNDNFQVLPMELLSFTGIQKDRCNVLTWVAFSELSDDYFVVEKSLDATHWTEVGTVKSIGDSIQKNNYHLNDCDIDNKTTYYRLKQIDLNGHYTYSSIVDVSRNFEQDFKLNIYPNPAHSFLNIKLSSINESKFPHIQITNTLGQVILEEEILKTDSMVDINHLENGVYYVTVTNTDFQKTVKIIKGL